ncbi:MAG: YicC family protein [Pigmentiphaga sp.]|uniref:YicC/YloC family endoribonuclease n=1 Tax=Pigmentiphaga sp. TaxID=1977564 RepID=UPI0029B77F04|nr:YicC/YloC family endoribonuclease [Pigmentiphaga sp.]MDX3905065.1 YicC family protein [Pigmentiphaga sp.]
MIRSMTAFGAARADTEHGSVSIELRSVNSRFLDLHFRMPDELRALEAPLRDMLTRAVARGKVEVRASIQRRLSTDPDSINVAALEQAATLFRKVQAVFPDAQPPRLAELLSWPGVQAAEESEDTWREAALRAAGEALTQMQEARDREGERLAAMIADRAAAVAAIVAEVETRLPQLVQEYRDRLARKLRDTVEAAFPGGFQHIRGEELSERLAHEATLFGLRVDVAEELSRLHSHLDELKQLIAKGGAGKKADKGSAGKRLDFLFQEMNREANTLGSKAGGLEVTRAAMDLKLLIEQMREQAQNIE